MKKEGLKEIIKNADDLYWHCLKKLNNTMARKANIISMAAHYELGKVSIDKNDPELNSPSLKAQMKAYDAGIENGRNGYVPFEIADSVFRELMSIHMQFGDKKNAYEHSEALRKYTEYKEGLIK